MGFSSPESQMTPLIYLQVGAPQQIIIGVPSQYKLSQVLGLKLRKRANYRKSIIIHENVKSTPTCISFSHSVHPIRNHTLFFLLL